MGLGTMERNQKLINWAREAVALKHATIFRLFQRDMIEDIVLELSVPSDGDGNKAEECADQIFEAAQADATGINQQVVSYVIKAFKKASSKGPAARFSFPISAVETKSTPDSVGMISMLMRHNETQTKAYNAAQNTMLANMARMLEQSGTTIEQLMEDRHKLLNDRLDIVQLVEELHSQKHAREIEAQTANDRAELGRELAGNVKLLLPAVVAKLGGRTPTNGKSTTPKEASIMALLASLDPEQLQQLQQILTPAQLIALSTVTSND